MSASVETRPFQAETQQLLDLMIHSLYSHRDIFLRELISNASDALDKRRVLGLTDESVRSDDPPRIRLEVDREARTLAIDDNGIGMTREEVVENLGTIAKSGTGRFLRELREASQEGGEAASAELIGQFGVGFYSAFMVAGEVVVETRRAGAGADAAVRWTSRGDGEFTVEDAEKAEAGTRVVLHLRPADDDDGDQATDFTETWRLREIVRRYSDFVEYPIVMDVERTETEDGEERTVVTTETLNSMKPLWTRPRAEIEPSEYQEFYRHLSHDGSEPLATIHFRAEGTHEYTALLFLPSRRPWGVLDPQRTPSRIALYVKRVFVMKECEELAPPWLRFVVGVVDSSDLPLNVSRESLQHNRQVARIAKRVVRKVLDELQRLLESDRETYRSFWADFGTILKEGVYLDDEHRDELAKLCLFPSSHGDEPVTLAEYVERMPFGQKGIYYVLAPDRRTAEAGPHTEAARARGYEVLHLVDPIDEWVVSRLQTFDGRDLLALDRGDVDLGDDESEKTKRDEQQRELQPLLGAIRAALEEHVTDVRVSSRLAESPAALVTEAGGLTPQLEAMLRASGQDVPKSKRVLEVNPAHPMVRRLRTIHEGDVGDGPTFVDAVELLHGQALLAEGSPPADPARFARLVADLLAREDAVRFVEDAEDDEDDGGKATD